MTAASTSNPTTKMSDILKACVRYFYQILTFSSNDWPSKTMKMFLFNLKSFSRSSDI